MTETAAAAPWPAMTVRQAYAMLTAPGSPLEMEEVDIRGVTTRVWKNAPPTLRAVVEAGRAHGEKIFLVHEDERVSFEAFHRAVAAFAAAAGQAGRDEGRPRRHRHAQPARMAGRLLRRRLPGRDRHPAERLVDRGRSWNTASTNSGSKVVIVDAERLERLAEHLPNCPDLKTVYVARHVEEIANPPCCGWRR